MFYVKDVVTSTILQFFSYKRRVLKQGPYKKKRLLDHFVIITSSGSLRKGAIKPIFVLLLLLLLQLLFPALQTFSSLFGGF